MDDPDPGARAHPVSTSPQAGQRRNLVFAVAALLLFAVGAVATYIPDQTQLSMFDEWVFLDYVEQAGNFEVAQRGEPVVGVALEVVSCRGVQAYGKVGSPCGGPYDTTLYPQGGFTAADVHPPTYFWATAFGASILDRVGPSDDLLTNARMMGALWLLCGLVLILMLAIELGAPVAAGVGVGGVITALPLTRYTNSYLTPDNFNLAAGALLMLAAVRFTRGRWPWWSLALAGAFAGAMKTQNILAVSVALLFIAWYAATQRQSPTRTIRELLVAAVAMVAGFFVVQLGWLVARSVLAVGEVPDQGVLSPIDRNLVIGEFSAFILALSQRVTNDVDPTTAYLSTAILIAGCVGAVLYRSARDDVFGVAMSTVTMLIVGSPLFVIAWYLVLGEVISSPTRYGGSLLPAMAAVTAAAFTSRARSMALCCFGTLAVGLLVIDNLLR